MHSHYDFSYVIKLSPDRITKLILYGIDKEKDRIAWDRWIAIYPYMELNQIAFMDFKKYKEKLLDPVKKYTEISNEEIEKEIMGIVKKYTKIP